LAGAWAFAGCANTVVAITQLEMDPSTNRDFIFITISPVPSLAMACAG
jgi:hypothetical protein